MNFDSNLEQILIKRKYEFYLKSIISKSILYKKQDNNIHFFMNNDICNFIYFKKEKVLYIENDILSYIIDNYDMSKITNEIFKKIINILFLEYFKIDGIIYIEDFLISSLDLDTINSINDII